MAGQGQNIKLDHWFASDILKHKLSRLAELSAEELRLIEEGVARPREFPGGVALPVQRRPLAAMVVSGWVGRLRLFADGRRQVVSTMVAGELVGQHPNPFFATATVALTDAHVADLTPLMDSLDREPNRYQSLRRAMGLAARLEEVQLAEQVVRLGRRSAFERLAHWLLDLQQRLAWAGLCDGERFQMPLTQETLSDILGMSIVHVNRIVKQLRAERLIDLRAGMITILEPERLRMITEFTPLQPVETTAAVRTGRSAYW